MSDFENKKNMKALAWTIGIHALLLLACFFFGFTSPPPLPNQDMGMEINLGTSSEGSGNVQPLNPNPPATTPATPSPAEASPASNKTGSQAENIVTQDEEDAPVINKTEKKIKHEDKTPKNIENAPKRSVAKPTNAPVEPKPAPPKPKAIYSGGSSNSASSGNNAGASNSSNGEGETGKAGDQGAVNGNPNATNHNGAYSGLGGNSLSYRLSGRRIVSYPDRQGQFNEPGRVRLSIKVDQQGNIISYRILNADNATIRELAEKKIKQIKFNANADAPVEQFGEITFVFKIQR